jgi:hypothetical protein
MVTIPAETIRISADKARPRRAADTPDRHPEQAEFYG